MDPVYPKLPESLETGRLLVRKYKSGDGTAILALLERNNNRQFLLPNVEEVTKIKDIDAAEVKVRQHAEEWEARKRFVMGIWRKKDSLYVGEIWIEPNQWNVPSFELGWFLDAGFLGKGFATEAANRSLMFLFNNLQAHKVIVITRDTNLRSIKLAERLGFKREGHFREARIENGSRYGLVFFGLLKSEFNG